MKKAFFINGGVGRVLCALPALEHYAKTVDPSVVIVAESWAELYSMSDTLRNNVYPNNYKDLMRILEKREIISPEPYRLNAYFTQKANLIQSFDMLINYKQPPKRVPVTKEFNLSLSTSDELYAKELIRQVKEVTGKDKVVVFQPLGSTAHVIGDTVVDESGRSFTHNDIIRTAKELSSKYAVVLMSNINIPTKENLNVAVPEEVNLLQWAAVIKEADYFLGCDSMGQHYANALNTPATVVIGSTFPENISYPSNDNFTIIDLGLGKRIYSPIRITEDEMINKNNEKLMVMDDATFKSVVETVTNKLGE